MAAGQFEQAAEQYLISLAADKTNVDAITGLKSAGQRAIDEKAIQVIRAQEGDDLKTAVYKFVEIRKFVEKASALGVTLLISDMATTSYNEAKPSYLEKAYGEAQQLLEAEKFKDAENALTEINRIEPNYSDVDELLVVAKCEPVYRAAQQSFSTGKYRSAYTAFALLVTTSSSYKDASDLMADALEKALMVIKVEPFKGKQGGKATALKSAIISSVNAKKNVFVKVIDANSTDKILEEQRNALALGADVEVGKILTPKAIMNGNITECSKKVGKLVKTEKRGYLKKIVKEKDASGNIKNVTVYDKVTYNEYSINNSATVNFSYQITSIETGEIIITDAVKSVQNDNVVYVEFSGDSGDLIPGYWEYSDRVSAKDKKSESLTEINALRAARKAKRDVVSADQLLERALTDVVSKVTKNIDYYNPEE